MSDLIGYIATPSVASHLACLAGLLAAVWSGTRRLSWPLLAIAGVINFVFSSGMVGAALISPLEFFYPTLHSAANVPAARRIVALTGWAAEDPDMPLSGRLNASSAYRVMLVAEYARQCPECSIVISGTVVAASAMQRVLLAFGINALRITVEGNSASTMESAAHLTPMLGKQPFILVTSGGHMPRAMLAMRAYGLQAVAAPTDHQLPKEWRNAEFLPTPQSLLASDLAFHEYLGLLWYRLRVS
jgi:uncharacterized SAM-binding protein YcdF (DUF218 family)